MKTRPSLILLLVFTLVAFVAAAVVYGQAGTGPHGQKVYNYSDAVVVIPTNLDPAVSSPVCAKPGTIGYYNGVLYVCGTNSVWARVTLSTVTPTPTSTNTPTPTP